MTAEEQLKEDEGEVLHLYYDSVGLPTISVGINLLIGVPKEYQASITITPEASHALFLLRLEESRRLVAEKLPWTAGLDQVRKDVLANMAFNLGIGGLLQFHNALALLQEGRFSAAAIEFHNSKWAAQVGARATRLCREITTGEVDNA